ncbi:MAG: HAD-IA family hydrolase [Bdellovibrionota bacterium]
MYGPIKNVVFDFDGTLVDTMSSVTDGLAAAIKHTTGREITREELIATFGPAPQGVLEQWMPKEKVPEAMAFWLNFEITQGPNTMKVFEGADDLLRFLKEKGYGLAIFTGRDRAGTLRILEAHRWLATLFTEKLLACGDDGHASKPSPEGLETLMRINGFKPADTLMVGDHPHDMMAGKAAGCLTGAALWDLAHVPGKTERGRFKANWEKWEEKLCDVRLSSPKSLVAWLMLPAGEGRSTKI